MAFLLLAGLAFFVVLRFARRRRTQFAIGPSDAISTMQFAMSKKHTAKVKSALESATSALR